VEQPPSSYFLCGIEEKGILMARVRQTPTTAERVTAVRRSWPKPVKGKQISERSTALNYSQLKSVRVLSPPKLPFGAAIY
jgi:hypothetical protein